MGWKSTSRPENINNNVTINSKYQVQCYIGSLLCMKKVVFGENNPDEFKPAMISGSDLINDVNSAPTGPGWLSLYCNTMIMDDYIIIMCETITFPHHNHEQIVWIYCNYM